MQLYKKIVEPVLSCILRSSSPTFSRMHRCSPSQRQSPSSLGLAQCTGPRAPCRGTTIEAKIRQDVNKLDHLWKKIFWCLKKYLMWRSKLHGKTKIRLREGDRGLEELSTYCLGATLPFQSHSHFSTTNMKHVCHATFPVCMLCHRHLWCYELCTVAIEHRVIR